MWVGKRQESVQTAERKWGQLKNSVQVAEKLLKYRVSQKQSKAQIGYRKSLEWQIDEGRFNIDSRGASYTAPTKNPLATHKKEIGTLMTAYGLVKGSPGITTVGVTTMSQPNSNEKGWTVRWKDVREVKINPEKRVVMLKEKWFTGGLGGGLGTYHIYCTPENYEIVASICQAFQSRKPQNTRSSKAG